MKEPKETIAEGREKRVFQDPEHPDRVISIFRSKKGREKETPRSNKARFYLTNILHILLPNSIPHVHWTGKHPDAFASKKIETDSSHKEHNDLITEYYQGNDSRFKKLLDVDLSRAKEIQQRETYRELLKKLRYLGINVDYSMANFSIHPTTGIASYLDHIVPWTHYKGVELGIDLNKLGTRVNNISDEILKKRAQEYLDRFIVLFEEEKREFEAKKNSR